MAPESLCLTTALAPVPAFFGGSCPLGCSLSAPATGGVHRESPCADICGRLREREAGRLPTTWGTIAHPFVFCKGGCGGGPGLRGPPADGAGWFCLGLRSPSAKGLAWPAPLSHLAHPPTFLETGGLPLYPRRGLRPCTLLGERRRYRLLTSASGRFLTCPRQRGQG